MKNIRVVRALQLPSKAAEEAALKAFDGLTASRFAFDPDWCPIDVDGVDDVAADVMHIFQGISRKEGAMMLKTLFKKGAGFVNTAEPMGALNAGISQLRLPHDKRISKIPPFKADVAFCDLKLDLNAAETMRFVMHSLQLVEPLLTQRGRDHAAWRSWLKHRELLQCCLKHAWKVPEDTDYLSRLVKEYGKRFRQAAS